ncbi:MAG: DUF3794 domain-containing protein [Clostridia bacterium]|nr:DUF3794 domain-containing protein [Clostridia bacterium]
MDLNLLTFPIGMQENTSVTTAENPFDLDISLPEYYPDIQRILCCSVQTNLHSVSAGTDRVTAEGNGVFRMLYATEDKQVAAFEQAFPISRSAPFAATDPSAAIRASAATDFVNARATGQRRVGVHGVISIRFSAASRSNISIAVQDDDAPLQVRTESVEAFSLCALAERSFAMSEVVEVGAQNPPVGRVLRADACVQPGSVKAVKDKLLIKGEVMTQILYAPDGEGDWVTFRHAMPLSQIVEAQGLAEENLHDISLHVLSLEVTPKTDGSGEERLLEIALRIRADVRSGVTVQMQAVCDAFSTEGTLCPKYADVRLLHFDDQIQETLTVKQAVDPGSPDIAQLIDVRFGTVQKSVRQDAQALTLQCEAPLTILYRDAQGDPVCAEKQVDFTYTCRLPESTSEAFWEPTVQISACKGMLTSDGKIDVRIEAIVYGTVYTVTTHRLLLSASLEQSQESSPAALTIYFADAGEDVWDIARKYRTTVSDILEENGLTQPTVPQSRMLVIPTA